MASNTINHRKMVTAYTLTSVPIKPPSFVKLLQIRPCCEIALAISIIHMHFEQNISDGQNSAVCNAVSVLFEQARTVKDTDE